MPKRIQLSRRKGWRKPEGAVIVARPSKWGNPFKVGETGWNWYYPELPMTQASAADMFRMEIETGDGLYQPSIDRYITVDDVRRELVGRDLACWCPLPAPGEPDICHGAVLLELANAGGEEAT